LVQQISSRGRRVSRFWSFKVRITSSPASRQDAVVLAAGDLGVEMAADGDRGQVVLAALTAGEDV